MRTSPEGCPRHLHSFTLVELLVVLAIISILAVLAVPSIGSIFESGNLSSGAQEVADQISLARQLASSKNITVEVRLFKIYGSTSSYTSGGYGLGYTAIQMWTNVPPTTAIATNSAATALSWYPVSRLTQLPQNIAVAENTAVSSAFAAFTSGPTTLTNAGATYNSLYYSFDIHPSGIVTPVQNYSNFCLAVLPARYATVSSLTGVKNFAVVQINPVTGTPEVFRP